MKRKRVWRYSCDFCKKNNCSASSVSRHEKRCTMNPHRYCGMCKTAGLAQQSMDVLLVTLADITIVKKSDDLMPNGWTFQLVGDIDKALEKLRDVCDNCPACILAVLRQKSIPLHMTTFDFTDECKRFWADINKNARMADHKYYAQRDL